MSNGTPTNQTVSERLESLAHEPKSMTGDQGQIVNPDIRGVIALDDYLNKKKLSGSRRSIRGVLRQITGHRLKTHDGRGS